jgi:hypothetical protein
VGIDLFDAGGRAWAALSLIGDNASVLLEGGQGQLRAELEVSGDTARLRVLNAGGRPVVDLPPTPGPRRVLHIHT